MARKLDVFRPTIRMMIEPWLVQSALDRLGDRQLTLEEQAEVWFATRTPHKVRWPEWWERDVERLRSARRPPSVVKELPDRRI